MYKDPKVLLNLPEEAEPFNGRLTHKRTRSLVIVNRLDFTQGSKPVSSTYFEFQQNTPQRLTPTESVNAASTQFGDVPFGAYSFNWMANWLHSFNYNFDFATPTQLVLSKDDSRVVFERFQDGSIEMAQISEVDPSGNPLTVPIITYSESVTWVNRPGVAPKTQKQTWRSTRKRFVQYTWMQVQAMTEMSSEQVLYNTRTSYIGQAATAIGNAYIANIATDIEISESGQYKGVVYINGFPSDEIDYRNMITSFGMLCPKFTSYWRLYNTPKEGFTITGATLVINADSGNEVITVAEGANDMFNADTKTLHYNPELDTTAMLLFFAEFGTTGKNENWGTIINLENGIETGWH